MDTYTTKFIFRVFKSGIVAAFSPYENYALGLCPMYSRHRGETGSDYDYCVSVTRQATDEEASPLIADLTAMGYRVKRIRKYIRK